MVVTSASIHSLSQDFNLSGEPEGPDLRWHMEWTGRRELLPIHHLRDPPEMSAFCDAEELWNLTYGMQRLCLTESARDAQRMQELTGEDLHLRRRRDVRVVPLPHGGGARTRQRRSGGLWEDGVDGVELLLLVPEFTIWGECRGSPLCSAIDFGRDEVASE
ncbi:hypothetical protein GIB67_002827 [Kingdonia uniflora]|uniref:Uncharacterized protein n=1 Tax=Kingdonia uniflora TaxID=39325 RepID=A0A7J7M5A2_9MAGN|nr:hypothetical protein GIB67_002827 [Kingdonia uniflora]